MHADGYSFFLSFPFFLSQVKGVGRRLPKNHKSDQNPDRPREEQKEKRQPNQSHAPKTASTFIWGSIATLCAHGIVVPPLWAPWTCALEWCEPRYTLGHEMRLTRSISAWTIARQKKSRSRSFCLRSCQRQ